MFLGREISEQRDYSDGVAQTIDEEVKSLIDTAYKAARTVLTEHRDKLTKLSQHLIEHETIEGDELNSLFGPPTYTAGPRPGPGRLTPANQKSLPPDGHQLNRSTDHPMSFRSAERNLVGWGVMNSSECWPPPPDPSSSSRPLIEARVNLSRDIAFCISGVATRLHPECVAARAVQPVKPTRGRTSSNASSTPWMSSAEHRPI